MRWFSLAICLGCLKWEVDLSLTYGLNDGGVLRPLAERLAWGGFVGLLGRFFAAGKRLHARLHIHTVCLDEVKQQGVFETLRLWAGAFWGCETQDMVSSHHRAG